MPEPLPCRTAPGCALGYHLCFSHPLALPRTTPEFQTHTPTACWRAPATPQACFSSSSAAHLVTKPQPAQVRRPSCFDFSLSQPQKSPAFKARQLHLLKTKSFCIAPPPRHNPSKPVPPTLAIKTTSSLGSASNAIQYLCLKPRHVSKNHPLSIMALTP